jgi:hypothetical protein
MADSSKKRARDGKVEGHSKPHAAAAGPAGAAAEALDRKKVKTAAAADVRNSASAKAHEPTTSAVASASNAASNVAPLKEAPVEGLIIVVLQQASLETVKTKKVRCCCCTALDGIV